MRILWLAPMWLALMFHPLLAEAKTCYLATTGLDTNDGSAAKPWKTFAVAGSKLLPGDVLEVAAGSYAEQVTLVQNGLAGSQVTVRAAPGAKVVIAGGGTVPTAADQGLLQIVGSHIKVEGIEVTGSKQIGVYLAGTSNTLTACTIHDNQGFGVHVYQAKAATVTKNAIYANVLANKSHTLDPHENALELYLAEGAVVTENKVYQNHGEGIAISRGKGNLVRGNRVYDNLSDEIFVNNTIDASVDGNFVYCTPGSGFEVGGQRPNGIVIGDSNYGAGATTAGALVINNIVIGCNVNLLWFATTVAGTGLKNALIAHNTLVQAADTGMQIDKGAHASTTLANNIIVQSNGLMINLNSGLAGLTFSHNNWLGGPAGAAASANDIVGNCDLADLASLDPAGFKLGQNAPCKDKGLALPVVKTDFFGTPRPVGAGYDVGAHEAVGTVPAADGGVKDAKPSASDAKPPSADTKLPASDGALPSGDAAKKPDGVGDGAARPDAGGPGNGDGGCGCFVAGAADPSLVGVVLLALALGLARARRRVR